MSIKAKPKRRRRPSEGRDPLLAFRAPPVLRAKIVKWAENQPDWPSLSESVRRLVEVGLDATADRSKYRSVEQVKRAEKLASDAVETLVDPKLPRDEKASRKHKLTKGPQEFRDERVDQKDKKAT